MGVNAVSAALPSQTTGRPGNTVRAVHHAKSSVTAPSTTDTRRTGRTAPGTEKRCDSALCLSTYETVWTGLAENARHTGAASM